MAELLTAIWCVADKYNIVPDDWLEGITVPLFKVKGSQVDPSNYRPLTGLSHARKITEKSIVLELDEHVGTDRAQYGFLAGVQVPQASLSVLSSLQ